MPDSLRIFLAGLVWLLCSHAALAADFITDPMRPDSLRSIHYEAPAQYRVNAIIVSDDRRIAIVNGKRVGIGDSVQRATIVSISKKEVIVEVGGVQQKLRLANGSAR